MRPVRMLDHTRRDVAEVVREVQRAAYAAEAGVIGYDGMPGLRETVEDVMRLRLMMLGLTIDAEVAGVLGYRRTGGTVDIDRLAVRPSRLRRGVGRELLTNLHVREQSATRFEVSTGADNQPAVRLYEAMGYRVSRRQVAAGVRLAHFARTSPEMA